VLIKELQKSDRGIGIIDLRFYRFDCPGRKTWIRETHLPARMRRRTRGGRRQDCVVGVTDFFGWPREKEKERKREMKEGTGQPIGTSHEMVNHHVSITCSYNRPESLPLLANSSPYAQVYLRNRFILILNFIFNSKNQHPEEVDLFHDYHFCVVIIIFLRSM